MLIMQARSRFHTGRYYAVSLSLLVIGVIGGLALVVQSCRRAAFTAAYGGRDNMLGIEHPQRMLLFHTLGYLKASTNGTTRTEDFFVPSGAPIPVSETTMVNITKVLVNPASANLHPGYFNLGVFLPEFALVFERGDRKVRVFVCVQSAEVLVKSPGFERRIDYGPGAKALDKAF
jgi:hypothetical protein